jgi:hypothetical protein
VDAAAFLTALLRAPPSEVFLVDFFADVFFADVFFAEVFLEEVFSVLAFEADFAALAFFAGVVPPATFFTVERAMAAQPPYQRSPVADATSVR